MQQARTNLAVIQQVVSLIAYLMVFRRILKIAVLFKATVLPSGKLITSFKVRLKLSLFFGQREKEDLDHSCEV